MIDPQFTTKDLYRFWSRVRPVGECWEWQGAPTHAGYGSFSLRHKMYLAHRIAYRLFFSAIPDGRLICHTCDNRMCVRPDHLYAGTHANNMADMVARGRHIGCRVAAGEEHYSRRHPEWMARGERAYQAMLTTEQVVVIRAAHATDTVTYAELGRRFGVKASAIRKVVLRITWAHVE